MPERGGYAYESRSSHALARHIASARVETLPAFTMQATCRDIFDTLGCMLGGSGAPGIDILRRVVARAGGREEAAALLMGLRVPAQAAALLNGAMAHALDFDDTHDLAGAIHPGAPTLAAALAAMELGGGATGSEFVLAVALGLDVACRVALASRQDRGWHRTAAMGVFGATAAASRLLRLDEDKTRHALGIALSQAAGTRQCIDDGSMTKRFQAGHAASAGVQSAILAAEGFTGAENTFAGRYGFIALYQPEDLANVERMTHRLGEVWEGDGLSLKPYPCFRPSHPAIALYRELDLAYSDVASVILETDEGSWYDQLAPESTRRRPAHVIEAQFSTPFLVALGLVRGRVTIDGVANVGDVRVLALADKMEGRSVPGRDRGWARLTVITANGRTATREVSAPSGSPVAPISDAALEAKFRDCARHAVKPLPKRQSLRPLLRCGHYRRQLMHVKSSRCFPAERALRRPSEVIVMSVLDFIVTIIAALAWCLVDPLNWAMMGIISMGALTRHPHLIAICTIALFSTFHIVAVFDWWVSVGADPVRYGFRVVWTKCVIGCTTALLAQGARRLVRKLRAPSAGNVKHTPANITNGLR